jgi:hypothetical protein
LKRPHIATAPRRRPDPLEIDLRGLRLASARARQVWLPVLAAALRHLPLHGSHRLTQCHSVLNSRLLLSVVALAHGREGRQFRFQVGNVRTVEREVGGSQILLEVRQLGRAE